MAVGYDLLTCSKRLKVVSNVIIINTARTPAAVHGKHSVQLVRLQGTCLLLYLVKAEAYFEIKLPHKSTSKLPHKKYYV